MAASSSSTGPLAPFVPTDRQDRQNPKGEATDTKLLQVAQDVFASPPSSSTGAALAQRIRKNYQQASSNFDPTGEINKLEQSQGLIRLYQDSQTKYEPSTALLLRDHPKCSIPKKALELLPTSFKVDPIYLHGPPMFYCWLELLKLVSNCLLLLKEMKPKVSCRLNHAKEKLPIEDLFLDRIAYLLRSVGGLSGVTLIQIGWEFGYCVPTPSLMKMTRSTLKIEQPPFNQFITSLNNYCPDPAWQQLCNFYEFFRLTIDNTPEALWKMPSQLLQFNQADFAAFADAGKHLSKFLNLEIIPLGLPQSFMRDLKDPSSSLGRTLLQKNDTTAYLLKTITDCCEALAENDPANHNLLLNLYAQLFACLISQRRGNFVDHSFTEVILREALNLSPKDVIEDPPTVAYMISTFGWDNQVFGYVRRLLLQVWASLITHIPHSTAISAIQEVRSMVTVIMEHFEHCLTNSEQLQADYRTQISFSDAELTGHFLEKLRRRNQFLGSIIEAVDRGLEMIGKTTDPLVTNPILGEILSSLIIALSQFYGDPLSELPRPPQPSDKLPADLAAPQGPSFIVRFNELNSEFLWFLKVTVRVGINRLHEVLGASIDQKISLFLKEKRLEESSLTSDLSMPLQPPSKKQKKQTKLGGRNPQKAPSAVAESRWDSFVAGNTPVYGELRDPEPDSESSDDWIIVLSKKRHAPVCETSSPLGLIQSLLRRNRDCPALKNSEFWIRGLCDSIGSADRCPAFSTIALELGLVHQALEGLLHHACLMQKIPIPKTHHLTAIASQLCNKNDDPLQRALCHVWKTLSLLSNLNNILHYPYSCSAQPHDQQLVRHLKAMRDNPNLKIHDPLIQHFLSVIEHLCLGMLGQSHPSWSVSRPSDRVAVIEELSPFFALSPPEEEIVEVEEHPSAPNIPMQVARDFASAIPVLKQCLNWAAILHRCPVEGEMHCKLRQDLRNDALANMTTALQISLDLLKPNPTGLQAIDLFAWIRRALKEGFAAILLNYPAYDPHLGHVMEKNRYTNSFLKLHQFITRFTPIQLPELPRWLGYLHEATHYPFKYPYHERPEDVREFVLALTQSKEAAVGQLCSDHLFPGLNYLLTLLRKLGESVSASHYAKMI